jgi:hypothetical protein
MLRMRDISWHRVPKLMLLWELDNLRIEVDIMECNMLYAGNPSQVCDSAEITLL